MAENKDHELFIAHYQNTKDKVFTYLMYRLSFDHATCEDLLMDIVLKAYENFHQFDQKRGSFKNWLFGIAHNHLVNHWRDRKEEVPLEYVDEIVSEPAACELPDQTIHKILSLLTETEREVITLRYLNDLSYEEIAEITDKNEGAIRTSLSRATDQFKTFYNKLYGKSTEKPPNF